MVRVWLTGPRTARVLPSRVKRVAGHGTWAPPKIVGFGSPEPQFVGSVHCSTGRGFRLPALSLSISRFLSLSFPLNLPESLSQLSLLLSISLCVQAGRTEKKEEELKGKEERKKKQMVVGYCLLRRRKMRKRKEIKEKERKRDKGEKDEKLLKCPSTLILLFVNCYLTPTLNLTTFYPLP
jgi:hypothetical protein